MTATFHAQHDWEDEHDISYSIVQAVAAVVDEKPTAIDPLYDALDPDALERLLSSTRRTPGDRSSVRVRFTFGGCAVRVASDGTISVSPDRKPDQLL